MFGIQFNLKKFGVGLAIIVVFNLFINYGINTFYKPLKYEDFCKPERLKQSFNTRERCEAIGGLWREDVGYEGGRIYTPESPTQTVTPVEIKKEQSTGWCDPDFTCRENFIKNNDVHLRNVFIVWVIAGIAIIGVSFFVTTAQTLSTSFVFSGLLSLIIGTLLYWSAMQDYLRFIILGIALGFLIHLAYRKLK